MNLWVCFALLSLLFSCNDDDYIPTPPEVKIECMSGDFSMAAEDTLYLKANVISPLETTLEWKVNGESVSTDSVLVFTKNEPRQYNILLTAVNADGEASALASVEVYGKYKHGTFVLSEGTWGQGGRLLFISPKGVVTDTVYRKENNGNRLGEYSQDLFIFNKKMYIVSQNGGNDGGFLTVLNAETLKQERVFQEELKGKVATPTHVAVLSDDDIYLLGIKGITRFNPTTGETALIKGSNGVRKNTMAVVNGKIFAAKAKNLLVIEAGKDSISTAIPFDANISGVLRSHDKNVWVSTADGKISKVNATDYSIIKTNETGLTSQLAASFAANPSITAKGDTLYVSGLTTKIYRHVFSTGETTLMVDAKEMVEDAGIVYNTCAVHPKTGEVYLNTIKSYANYDTNNSISVFNFSSGEARLVAAYKNYTRYHAGTFFTYNFE